MWHARAVGARWHRLGRRDRKRCRELWADRARRGRELVKNGVAIARAGHCAHFVGAVTPRQSGGRRVVAGQLLWGVGQRQVRANIVWVIAALAGVGVVCRLSEPGIACAVWGRLAVGAIAARSERRVRLNVSQGEGWESTETKSNAIGVWVTHWALQPRAGTHACCMSAVEAAAAATPVYHRRMREGQMQNVEHWPFGFHKMRETGDCSL